MHGAVGPYVITAELARGGMGVVYKARDSRANREVALKLLQATSQNQRLRFQREVDSLMRLRHRYVVSAHDAGEFRGHPYLVLDLVEGESLQTRIDRGGPLEPEDAVDIVRKLAQAVAYAHVQGVLHRDIKPANVLIDEQGEPRLTDFGLAKLADGDTHRLSQTGMAHGTPGFWAPEQAIGELKRIGPPTDVYGLGATLYAALLGRPPVDGASFMELLVATREKRPDRPGVDTLLDTICLRCLEKDPVDRYASATELEQELLRWSASEQRTNPLHWLIAAGGALAALSILVLVFWLGRAEEAARPPAPGAAEDPTPSAGDVARAEADVAALADTGGVASEAADDEDFEEEPQTDKEWLELGLKFERTKDHDRAVQAYTRAIELNPGYDHALNNRGWNREQLGDLEGALSDYTGALLANPEYAQAWLNRGLVKLAQARYAEAISDFDRAIALDPKPKKKADVYADRGQAKRALKDLDGAQADFDAALALDPENQTALGGRSVLRQTQGDVAGGLDDLGRSILEKGKSDDYKVPTRAVGDERLAHDVAGLFGSERYRLKVQNAAPTSIRDVFAALGAERSAQIESDLREVWIVMAHSRASEGRMDSVALFRFQSEEAARRMLGFDRAMNEIRDEQLLSVAGIERVTTRYREGSGVPGVEGFFFTRRMEGSGEEIVALGNVLQVGTYVLEIGVMGLTEDQTQALATTVVEWIRTAIRKKE